VKEGQMMCWSVQPSKDMVYEIEKLHLVLVELLDYFVSICEKNGLTYVLMYGTALGAYRHKGFIPWDDDLDVGMPRKDYQKFIQVMCNTDNSQYSIQNEINEENWFLTFSKLRKNNTVFIEEYANSIYKNNGIYIDIFPLDYINDYRNWRSIINLKIVKYVKHTLKFTACKHLYKSRENLCKYFMDNVICLPIYLNKRKNVLAYLNKRCIGNCTIENAKYIAEYDDPSAQSIPYSIYFPTRKLEFEGKWYSVPGKIENYLTFIYGATYMQLPPVEERRTHQPQKIKF